MRPLWPLLGVLELSLECGAEVGAGEKIVVWALDCVADHLLRSSCVEDARVELCDLAFG